MKFAKEHQLDAKTDSRMFNSLIRFLWEQFERQGLTVYAMQNQIDKLKKDLLGKDEVIQKLRDEIFKRKQKKEVKQSKVKQSPH